MSSQAVSPGYVIELGFWTKLDIIAGMILFFVIVITIVVCSITPICPLFRFCPFNKKFLKNADGLQTNYGTLNTKPSNKKKVLRPYIMDIQKEVESSDYSDCNFGDHMELSLSKMDENEKDPSSTTVNGSTKTTKVGRLSYKLKYEQDLKKLTIKIIKANDLMLLEPNSLPVDNYVRIRLYRSQRSIFNFNRHKQHQSFSFDKLDLEVQTRIKRKTENPVFNEKFAIFVEEKHLKNYIMRLQMCDFDHYSCHTVKGETQSKFCEMKIFNGEEKSFDCEFTEPIEDSLGEAYICLTYLPTAEKLYFKLTQITGLPVLSKETNCTDAYVRVALMSDGRAMKKTKTSLRNATNGNPIFNETYIFDVPNNQLENIYFIISVLHHNKRDEKSGYLIGRIYVGAKFDKKSKYHWEEMVRHSRKEIGTWYKIKG
ncbi:synaptotagmin-C isoform X2 [Octopus sinensis]|uniref:Synaptotagmin-C isoform X2 n=1 Tax=Octopus sinensis TaxID=2607531 RepID=A0A6P7SC85_9MOLL|nr:synaptotagmin-C isoform X2 [Octopus sinensis]